MIMRPRGKKEWQMMVHKANLEESLHSPPADANGQRDVSKVKHCRANLWMAFALRDESLPGGSREHLEIIKAASNVF